MAWLVLRVCDRFKIDPDRARALDASVVGLLEMEQEMKGVAAGG